MISVELSFQKVGRDRWGDERQKGGGPARSSREMGKKGSKRKTRWRTLSIGGECFPLSMKGISIRLRTKHRVTKSCMPSGSPRLHLVVARSHGPSLVIDLLPEINVATTACLRAFIVQNVVRLRLNILPFLCGYRTYIHYEQTTIGGRTSRASFVQPLRNLVQPFEVHEVSVKCKRYVIAMFVPHDSPRAPSFFFFSFAW